MTKEVNENTYINSGGGAPGGGEADVFGRTGHDFEAAVEEVTCQTFGPMTVSGKSNTGEVFSTSLNPGETKHCGGVPVSVSGPGRFRIVFTN